MNARLDWRVPQQLQQQLQQARPALHGDAARLALHALHAELCLYPKPGLVSPVDSGSHDDMDAALFMRSLFSLRHYFAAACRAGAANEGFHALKRLGIAAERRMLAATAGVNTHRGAIFGLGMLCAALGRTHAQGVAPTPSALRAVLLIRWGEELAAHARADAETVANDSDGAAVLSHGLRAAALHGAGGAREEGALGFPAVFEAGLPALRATLARGAGMRAARIDALFALMARIGDTNVYHRGGADGAAFVQAHAQRFIDDGGTAQPHWQQRAQAVHALFVARRLSPGGAADLLAATCFVHAATVHTANR